ncbi:hypothetical protein NL108_004120 [Boleophthalmus pectinirostris]|uniref:histamine N-methyltransferase-like n=1 Tax=Boleophthalmus pectinirostris TaxID=150288 RepID=UPI00242FD513|nr:histamine N-methyltransferase-like [Boleophthalmus pectinirostris]XP_055019730.1 histamine N-methyltransferase-like [Boleophthalmus pectinirostris]KAJ0066213.1 hypothetical protein NL108_004120 [Boleophthalmus pectinirostris]
MASTPRPTPTPYDTDKYPKTLKVFLDHCGQRRCKSAFIQDILPNILSSIGNGKSQLNVIGVGSGAGDVDVEMLTQLHLKHPWARLDYETVEPSRHQLRKFRETVNQNSHFDFVKFTWNEMTDTEFEEHWKQKNITKKVDFIHMVEMLYYVKDPEAAINFFHSLLDKNGKLLIILADEVCSQVRVSKVVQGQLCQEYHPSSALSIEVIKSLLDARGVVYESYQLLSTVDITDCFTEGHETGELLLDFLTKVQDFSKRASPELRREVMTVLRDCSVEKDGRVMANDSHSVLIINALD